MKPEMEIMIFKNLDVITKSSETLDGTTTPTGGGTSGGDDNLGFGNM